MLLIAAVAVSASIAGIANEFAQDDVFLVQDDPRVHDLAHWRELFASPFWPSPFSPDLYRPLTSVLLSLQYVFGAGDPTVFRVVSYVLYAALAVSVFRLAAVLVPPQFALAAGLLFAAHPVHVEAVALAVGQSELATALIAVVSTRRYILARRRGTLTFADWTGLGLMYFAACLLKEQGFLIPAFWCAAEITILERQPRREIVRLAAGYGALGAMAAMAALMRRMALGEMRGTFVAEALTGLAAWQRALTMLRVVPAWVRLLVWPAHLQADYSPQEIVASHHLGVREALGLAIIIAVICGGWRARRPLPSLTFALLWCAVALAPVSNVIVPTGIVLAERTLMLPSVGAVICIAAAASRATALLRNERARTALASACLLVVALGIGRSAERQRVWRNEAFLAVRTVQDAPRSFRAQRAYGDVAFAIHQPRIGFSAYQRALELIPADQQWRLHNDFARTLRRIGEREAEAGQLRASLAQRPDQEDTWGYLVGADLSLAQYARAAAEADTALARGGTASVFQGLRHLADSAARAGAPRGAIMVGINTGAARRAP